MKKSLMLWCIEWLSAAKTEAAACRVRLSRQNFRSRLEDACTD